MLAKSLEKSKVENPKVKIPTIEKKDIGLKQKAKGKSLPKNQRGPRSRAHKTKLFQASGSQEG